ncbi:N-formylglutamate amidohydrolase [Antarcticibacterium sp. 1MA-6-2]|uniref:N-formylglutamate amidohydrolase n=1 Tax=Antarcticibacterium sp. 1MA-6-2 TaxID=2908210 RepID=UPI001F18C925|nr:N-formylglutamate amidohydrolase [Antarcticibacterium sp. 1MA-6-2]UJH91569.1 N-formylglutamate amidohydrolase [Antarcticibacterium sp. 1MA-6-2]
MKLLLTCEHGGNEIPENYLNLFLGFEDVLTTHRGFDPGALDLFRFLGPLSNFELYSTTSRLLVELNRSLHHAALFSEITKSLFRSEKEEILASYYLPYRKQVEEKINRWLKEGESVVHISVHSFTPILEEITRNADIGILFDPSRADEKLLAKSWKGNLKILAPHLRVRFNYPYKGTADGFTTYLRKKFPENYIGIELEVNQKFTNNNEMKIDIKNTIFKSVQDEIRRRQKE